MTGSEINGIFEPVSADKLAGYKAYHSIPGEWSNKQLASKVLPSQAAKAVRLGEVGIGLLALGLAGLFASLVFLVLTLMGTVPLALLTYTAPPSGSLFWLGHILTKKESKRLEPFFPPPGSQGYLYTRGFVKGDQTIVVRLVELTVRISAKSIYKEETNYLTVRYEKTFASQSLAEAEDCLELFAEYAREYNNDIKLREIDSSEREKFQDYSRALNRTV